MMRSRLLRWSLVGSMAVGGAALVLARPLLAASEVKPVPTTQKLPQVSKPSQVMKRVDVDMGTATPGSGQRFDVLPGAGGPVVRDNQTGRMWERAPAATKYSFAAAKAMCDAKVLGGHSDWRLPRVEELQALLPAPVEPSLLAGSPFTASGERWTSTELSATAAHYVLSSNGNTFVGVRTTQYAAWCVRGGGDTSYPNSNPRFRVTGLEVEDTKTGRVWKRGAALTGRWGAARMECLGSGPAWRLPTQAELAGLLDMSAPESPKLPVGHPFTNTWAPYDGRPWWAIDGGTVTKVPTLRMRDGVAALVDRGSVEGTGRCIKMDLAATWPLGPVGRFVVQPGGAAVLDQETRLLWEAAPTMTGVQYPTASAACAGKTLAGLGGWRLPSQEELWTLLDRHVTSGPKLPAGHPFVGIQVGDYWTRTPQPNGSDMLTQDLGSGQSGHMSQMGGQLIGWCVRPEP